MSTTKVQNVLNAKINISLLPTSNALRNNPDVSITMESAQLVTFLSNKSLENVSLKDAMLILFKVAQPVHPLMFLHLKESSALIPTVTKFQEESVSHVVMVLLSTMMVSATKSIPCAKPTISMANVLNAPLDTILMIVELFQCASKNFSVATTSIENVFHAGHHSSTTQLLKHVKLMDV